MKKPFELYILSFLLLILSLNALYGGGALLLAPDGSLLQIQPEWIAQSPFTNYFIPGLILFLFNGIIPLMTLIGLHVRPQWKEANILNIYKDKHWGWTYSLYCGIIAVLWIAIQQLMTRYFILQPLIVLVGILIIVNTLLPRIMRFYTIKTD